MLLTMRYRPLMRLLEDGTTDRDERAEALVRDERAVAAYVERFGDPSPTPVCRASRRASSPASSLTTTAG